MKLTNIYTYIYILLILCAISLISSKSHHSHSRAKVNLSERSTLLSRYHSHNKISHKNSRLMSLIKVKQFTEERIKRQDDDIPDPEVVYSILLASHKVEGSTCPYPLELADSKCSSGHPFDMNEGRGGNYVYLCVAKKKISELAPEEEIINTIKINRDTNDCGDLKLLDTKINSDVDLYICYGHQENLPPITKISFQKLDASIKGVNTKDLSPNCTIQLSKTKFLCLDTDPKAPRKIEFKNLVMGGSFDSLKDFGKPELLSEIENDNTGSAKINNTIKRQIVTTIQKVSSWNLENKYGGKVEVSVSVGVPLNKSGVTVSSSADMSVGRNKGETKTSTESTIIDFACMAPATKYYRCKAFSDKKMVQVPYRITRKLTLYDGSIKETQMISSFTEQSSTFRFERCCIKNCDPKKDNICPGEENKNSQVISKSEFKCPDLNPEPLQSDTLAEIQEDKISPENEYNYKLITDIKVGSSEEASTPSGYQTVACHALTKDKCPYKSKNQIYYKATDLKNLSSQPINIIRISKNTINCGTLNSVSQSINNKDLFICYGHDANSKNSPISEISMIG